MATQQDKADPLWFLAGGGISGASARAVNWSENPLGPPQSWPNSLKSTVAMLLHSRHPMFLWWGEELIQFYNDAYLPSIGNDRHPMAMGQRGADCWQEIWPIIWPQIESAMQRGEASWNEDHLVPISRNDRLEEVYWTYGYSPVFDDEGAIAGTLVVCTETTARVVSERRLLALQTLTEAGGATASPASLLADAVAALERFPNDVPFVLIYDHGPGGLQQVACVGLGAMEKEQVDAEIRADLRHRVSCTGAGRAESKVITLRSRITTAPWPEPVTQAYITEMPVSLTAKAGGWAVFGASPRLPLNKAYRQYFEHLTERMSESLARRWGELEREKLLGKVRAEQQRLADLFAQAPAFMCVLEGPKHVFTLANERYYELVGRRDIIGKSVIEAIPEVQGQGFVELLDHVYRSGEAYVGTGVSVELASGANRASERRVVDFVYQAFRDPNGDIVGIVVHGVDQTERHRAEQALRDADRRKDEFLAILAHELRNPLAPIANYAQLLGHFDNDAAAVKKASAAMQRQVAQMTRLIDDLLDVSRISSGKITLRRQVVDMVSVVRQAAEGARPHFAAKATQLTLGLPPTPVHVNGDEIRLIQVVGNLLENAVKFVPRGGHVWLNLEQADRAAVLRVRDDGIGIDADQLSNIFQMFTQADTSPDHGQGGLGIGLGLVRILVDMHGGSVRVNSAGRGSGSEFMVCLPMIDAEAKCETVGEEIEPGRPVQGLRVLLVDDNRDACDSLAQLLRTMGYETRCSYKGSEALEQARTFEPDVILLDLGMPGLSGYEVCRRLRQTPWCRRAQIVAVTGWGQAEDRRRTADVGFDAHLLKPVDLERLHRVLSQVALRN